MELGTLTSPEGSKLQLHQIHHQAKPRQRARNVKEIKAHRNQHVSNSEPPCKVMHATAVHQHQIWTSAPKSKTKKRSNTNIKSRQKRTTTKSIRNDVNVNWQDHGCNHLCQAVQPSDQQEVSIENNHKKEQCKNCAKSQCHTTPENNVTWESQSRQRSHSKLSGKMQVIG
eukprot:5394274-Amphidinium_carterae.1